MKKTFAIFFCFLLLKSFSQEDKDLSILTNTKNWKKEIIKFPIDWAPEVKLVGFEELRFAPNWNKPNNNEFWSLVMAWSIDSKSSLPQQFVIKNFRGYFNGLMKPNHWAKEFPEPKVKISETTNNKLNFNFSMTFFDGFHTGKVMTVHVKTNQFFCETTQRTFITFYISPKNLNNKIWQSLEEITVDPKLCNPKEKASLIKLDSTWGKEIFPFPINFAKAIPYQGFEEARFPPKGWSNEKHPNFWSYTFAWSINLKNQITVNELQENLKLYFDGLSNQTKFKTSTNFTLVEKENNRQFFKGNLTIFDNFRTKKPLLLNVTIESFFCKKDEKSTILFKFSPKKFTHRTWQMLNNITLIKPNCN